MATLKLASLLDNTLTDARTILAHLGIDRERFSAMDHGTSGCKVMWQLWNKIEDDRKYDDTHPAYAADPKRRILPFDGRPAFYQRNPDANDTHIESLLRKVKDQLFA